jgi:hypothetical protein
MKTVVRKTWRELSEAAAREQDPEKLFELIQQLNRALEEQGPPTKNHTAAPLETSSASSSSFPQVAEECYSSVA